MRSGQRRGSIPDFWATSWDPDSLDPTLQSLIESGNAEAVRDFLVGAEQSEVALGLALLEAIFHRNAEVVECLINAGAPINSTYDFSQDTPLHFNPTYEILRPTPLECLFGDPLDDLTGPTYEIHLPTPLQFIFGVSPDDLIRVRTFVGELSQLTPLHCAARCGDVGVVRCLLKAGAPVEARSASDDTPLHSALSGWSSSVDAMQVNQQAADHFNSQARPLTRATPAHYAEIVKLLVDNGSSVDSASPADSLLYYAVHVRNLDIVRYLVEHAVDKTRLLNAIHVRSKLNFQQDCFSALWRAVRWRDLDMVRYLVEAGANPLLGCIHNYVRQLAIHAAFYPDTDGNELGVIRYLIRVDKSQMGRVTAHRDTCLHLAAATNNAVCAAWLLDRGASCAAINWKSETPWGVARRCKSWAVISLFITRERKFVRESLMNVPQSTWLEPHGGHYSWYESKMAYASIDKETWFRFFGLTPTSYPVVLNWIDRSFGERGRSDVQFDSYFYVREPICSFETLKHESGLRLMSLCIPFFSSVRRKPFLFRWDSSLKSHLKMKYCQPHDPKSFGPDIEVTLDEYCNPTLGSTLLQQRNKDQVLGRYLKKQQLEGYATGDNLVMVSQLWCWKIESKLMFSGDIRVQRHVQQALYHDDLDIYIGRILSFLIDRLDKPHTFSLTEPIFSIFSRSISVVAEDVNRYTDSTTFGDINIQEERKLLHNINDIREEIAMMETVLFQQEEIWKEFTYNTWPQFWPDGENGRFKSPFNHENEDAEVWREIAKPQSQFSKYRKRFQKLDEDAERVERHILVQLDLKQKHAALKETHTTTVMSASVVGFTVITVIFAPLSFLTSLFALPVDHFSQNQQDGKYTVNYIGKWIATGEIASLAVTAVAILLACVYFLNLRVTTPTWMPVPSLNLKGSHGKISKKMASWTSRKRGHSRDVEQQHNPLSRNPHDGTAHSPGSTDDEL